MTTLGESDAAAVTNHNREIWDRCAPTYATVFEHLTGGATTPLLDLAGVGVGTELLDVGTGPGTLIGPALERGASVTAIDLAPAMVDQARLRHPGTSIEIGDATHLTQASDALGAITMGFCLHHIPNPHAVLVEVHRALRPGGRVAFAVWAPAEQLDAFGLAFDAVSRHTDLGDITNLQPPAIGSDPQDYIELLHRAGFAHAHARTLDLTWQVTDGHALFDGFDRFLDLSIQDPDARPQIREAIDREIRRRLDADGTAHLANPAIVATAVKL